MKPMSYKKGKRFTKRREKPEFDQQILDLARVTRVTRGGKQLSFRALVLIGDRKGRVGFGVEKGKDVQIAVNKAVHKAKKNIIRIPIVKDTVPHAVQSKFKAAKVLIKPAPKGTGIIAGSVIRNVLEYAGVPNASSKMLGKTNNKIANVKATFAALQSFQVKAKPVVKKAAAPEKQEKKVVAKKVAPKKKVASASVEKETK